jgi:hypothetical protein
MEFGAVREWVNWKSARNTGIGRSGGFDGDTAVGIGPMDSALEVNICSPETQLGLSKFDFLAES